MEKHQHTTLLDTLELRQKVDLLNLNNRLLEQELATLHNKFEGRVRTSTSQHIKQIEQLFSRNTLLLKQTI